MYSLDSPVHLRIRRFCDNSAYQRVASRPLLPVWALAILAAALVSFGSSSVRAQSQSQAQASGSTVQKLSVSLRIGLSYIDDETNAGDYSVADFGSRISWSGRTQLAAGLSADGYVELGLDSDNNLAGSSGADQTRQLWAGLSGLWGSLRVGAQYGSFYNMISSHTDIATWGSCWTQHECSRKTQVLKYQSMPGPLVFSLSATAEANDVGNDAADQIEYGFNYGSAAFLLGLAGVNYSDNASGSGGTVLGGVLKANLDLWSVTLGYQKVDQSVAVSTGVNPSATSDVTNITLAMTYGNTFLVYNMADIGSAEPDYLTVGLNQQLASQTSINYEYQQVSNDNGSNTETYARAILKHEW